MDPIVQGLAGGIAALSFAPSPVAFQSKKTTRICFITGTLAGLAPDLDILIRSSNSPLMELEYHRHFTHSLLFIPFGALIVALACFLFLRKNGIQFLQFFIWALLGYGTHGIIDACTSYGTQLLWPFSDARIAWNNVAIIDPIVSFILTLGSITALLMTNRTKHIAATSIILVTIYLLFGVIQRDRALKTASELANSRNHIALRLVVKPTIFNNVLFRSIYEYQDSFYVDAIRVNWWGHSQIYEGTNVPKLNLNRDLPWLKANSDQYLELNRYRWFSDDYVYLNPKRPGWIGDLRFALLPNEIDSLWWLVLDNSPGTTKPTDFRHHRNVTAEKTKLFWGQILGTK